MNELEGEYYIDYVQEHSMLKYQRAWLSSINKGYNPNKPNKLKVYASINLVKTT